MQGKLIIDMKKILFLTAYSDYAATVFRYAANLARFTGARLTLAHIFPEPLNLPVIGSKKADEESLSKKIEAELARLQTFAQSNAGAGFAPDDFDYLAVQGDPVLETLALEQSEEFDLLVIGRTTKPGFRDMIFGSVAQNLIERSNTHLLLVSPMQDYTAIQKIAYAFDIDQQAFQYMKWLTTLSEGLQAELRCVHIADNQKETARATQLFEQLFKPIAPENRAVPLDIWNGPTAGTSLKNYILETGIDLLAMKPHKRGFLGHIFYKSFTAQMIQELPIPILVLK